MAFDVTQFAMQACFNITTFDLSTGMCLAKMEDMKKTTFSNDGDIKYAQGGRGNPKIVGFDMNKACTLSCENALVTAGIIAMQTGTDSEILTTSTGVMYQEVLTVSTADELTTKFTATGSVGSEIGYIYKLATDGSVTSTNLQQAATAATGKFTYTSATKKITFSTGEGVVGTSYLVCYYPTTSTVLHLANSTDVFSKSVKVVADGLFRDKCTKKDYAGQIVIPTGKVNPKFEWSLSADSDPIAQSFEVEALKNCSSTKLWDLYIYDTSSIA